MAGINLKQLNSIQKSLEAVFSEDDDVLQELTKGLDGLRAAVRKGDAVSVDDISDILGEVVIDKAVEPPASAGEDPADPLAPIFKGLYDQLFDQKGVVKKGVSSETAQELIQKAYGAALGQLDAAIEAAAEAAAIELGQGARVNFGKAKKGKPAPDPADDGEDEDCEDMEKLLKSLGASPAVVKKIGTLQTQVDQLQTERDLETFGKKAVELGEGEAFGADLLKLHRFDPKLADQIGKRLATKNELLKKSSLWGGEIGGGTRAGESPNAYDQLSAHATEMVQKGQTDDAGKKLTFAKAFTAACTLHPDLYQEYRANARPGR